MTPKWYNRAIEHLEEAHERGDISYADFKSEMSALNEDLREYAADTARDAYEDAREEW